MTIRAGVLATVVEMAQASHRPRGRPPGNRLIEGCRTAANGDALGALTIAVRLVQRGLWPGIDPPGATGAQNGMSSKEQPASWPSADAKPHSKHVCAAATGGALADASARPGDELAPRSTTTRNSS
jgi:hypothetical protein